MTLHIRGYCERAATPAEPGTPIRFTASTEGVARDGLVIEQRAWQLDNFRGNPVVLWAHDYGGRTLPIGRADNLHFNGGNLIADITFDQDDDFARKVESKYRSGYLHAVSVGWDTQEIEPDRSGKTRGTVKRADLLDISAVPVPGDPSALKRNEARSLSALGRELLTLADTEADSQPDELDWQGTAALMARLFSPAASQSSDTERQRLYDRLEARYRRAGKTAPEFLALEHVSALGVDERSALFFHGEPDLYPDLFDGQRAGAVLSTRNRNDLEEAARLITGVVARAQKAPETDDDMNADDGQRVLTPDAGTLKALRSALGITE